MAPKSAGKEKLIEEDDVLQAVILADSFNKRFKPLTTSKPRCLLPICNAPLLDWTFESLALAGVQEIFVVCRSHANLVKAAIRESKWSRPSSGLKIVPIVTAKETFSAGDAMRDVYTHGIITSDFVLVTGDLVSSVRIDEVVRAHKERRKTNKDAIMTMVVKESGAQHRTRSRGESSVFVLDSETQECLHYEPVVGYPATTHTRIPREVLTEHPDLDIRNDLIDCHIDVCSVEVPSLFQDNFDYQDIRKDFVHGILTSDLLMKNIYCYVAKDGYAARVEDTRSYDSVSKDILSRWTFPLVPDDNHPSGHSYEYLRGNRYIAKDNSVVLSRSCKVGNNTLIGAHTTVHDNAEIIASVIGQGCTIGAGTVIKGAYIFDGTSIGPGCHIEQSIVGAGVTIKEGSRVERGCLVGDGVEIGPHAVVVPFERLSKRREARVDAGADGDDEGSEDEEESEEEEDEEEDEDDEEDEDEGDGGDDDDGAQAKTSKEPRSTVKKPAKEKLKEEVIEDEEDSEIEEIEANQDLLVLASLGENTNAIVWPHPTGDDDSDVEPLEAPDNQRLMRIGDDASDLELSDLGSITDDDGGDNSSDSSDEDAPDFSALASSLAHPADAPSGLGAASDARLESEFKHEVALSLERAFAEGHSVDNAAVELKTLRMASNVPLIRVREAVVGAIVEQIEIVEGAAEQRKEIAGVIGRWGDLINQIGGVDAVETVSVLQQHCAASERMPLFGQILASLYQDDVVEEDDIRKWYGMPASKGVGVPEGPIFENTKKCWAVGARMIAQFDEQDSDEESE
ncbi:nucleotide-diphospho-sugar transferase [Athelia psychrophila]|uniref:Translation initiation factor eIF2B subunit epsilon n=1 Tax=Athelia psychrophila TaxID=1759441 RepID=A0A166N8E7_9AGAM|nr:nucleotide-diphospho-sugar transferase [Fibularhizoctonia sp. CBS 109695]